MSRAQAEARGRQARLMRNLFMAFSLGLLAMVFGLWEVRVNGSSHLGRRRARPLGLSMKSMKRWALASAPAPC